MNVSNNLDPNLKSKYEKNMKIMEQKIRDNYKKAFFKLLEDKVAAEPPDYEWITKLYSEIRTKLISLLKEGSDLRIEIENCMDIQIFHQQISNKVFKPMDFHKLITYVLEKCKQLGSPQRDTETTNKFNEIFNKMQIKDAQFSDIVPIFIKNANECIDMIYEDTREFHKAFNKFKDQRS